VFDISFVRPAVRLARSAYAWTTSADRSSIPLLLVAMGIIRPLRKRDKIQQSSQKELLP
jgi:hypothetical protein